MFSKRIVPLGVRSTSSKASSFGTSTIPSKLEILASDQLTPMNSSSTYPWRPCFNKNTYMSIFAQQNDLPFLYHLFGGIALGDFYQSRKGRCR